MRFPQKQGVTEQIASWLCWLLFARLFATSVTVSSSYDVTRNDDGDYLSGMATTTLGVKILAATRRTVTKESVRPNQFWQSKLVPPCRFRSPL